MHEKLREFYSFLSDNQKEVLLPHLKRRVMTNENKKRFSVVFDVLHDCNIHCLGCGTDSSLINEERVYNALPALNQIEAAFKKILEYSSKIGMPAFINVGGGEPFLRDDILEILEMASGYFGVDGVGVDTNAAIVDPLAVISNAMQYVSYFGISINGLKDYHNWWSGNSRVDSFGRATAVVQELCQDKNSQRKLEVTSVATKMNVDDIPELMSLLHNIGVCNYSVHRAVPVGRMESIRDLVPNAKEYFKLLVNMLLKSGELGISAHIHHSIESIHAALLLGMSTYYGDKIGNPDFRSSLGVEPGGELVYDPWCTVGFWKQLSAGNIFKDGLPLSESIMSKNTIITSAKQYTSQKLRCHGCKYPCSGGSRIIAAATEISRSNSVVDKDSLLNAMMSVDPACPLYDIDKE